ncbi:MAG: aminotransferase class IV [Pyrinomonadaceae bacterium]
MHATNATLYGKGIFTTLAIYDREPFLWGKHWRRLTDNAAKIGIDLSEYSEETTGKALDEIIEKDNVTNGRARVTFFDESPSSIWLSDTNCKTNLRIITGDPRLLPPNFRLTVSPYPLNSRSPLAGVKSCNYLENLISFQNAKTGGFDEAVRLNERGEIASACMANVFWLRENRLYTPSLKTGCLAGTTREFVLEKLECSEVETGIEELEKADTIFLTSAGIGIVAINDFDGTILERPDHPLVRLV